MSSTLLLLVMISGPVGSYLGYWVGKTEVTSHTRRDSIHYYLPTPADSVKTINFIDTTTVIAETIVNGDPAWILSSVVNGDTSFTSTDTAYEAGDSLLYGRWQLGDSIRTAAIYRVPFVIGNWWRTGLAGNYIVDINGDSIVDTLKIWADTVRVLDTTTVTVPAGIYRGVYLIRSTMRQSLAMTYQGIPMRESTTVRAWEWYKDSVWRVKDSTSVTGTAYARLVVWVRLADFVITEVGQLLGSPTAVNELAPASSRCTDAEPLASSIFTDILLLRPSPNCFPAELRVFDTQGRLRVRRRLASGEQRLAMTELPAGAYILELDGDKGRRRQLIIKTR